MKKGSIVVLIACMAWNANAQTSDSITTKRKNELLIDLGHAGPEARYQPGILYRRNFTKTSLRLRVNGNSALNRHAITGQEERTIQYRAAIGLEKNVPLRNNFQFYWGAEAFYSGTYVSNHSIPDSLLNVLYHNIQHRDVVGLAPLVGLKFHYKRLAAGVELSGLLGYVRQRYRYESPDLIAAVPDTHQESFDFSLHNAGDVFIGFTF